MVFSSEHWIASVRAESRSGENHWRTQVGFVGPQPLIAWTGMGKPTHLSQIDGV